MKREEGRSIRALALAREFDDGFRRAIETSAAPDQGFLAIRVGADPYALRVIETSGLYSDKRITKLPTSSPGLLGLAGIRGVAVPTYDIGVLLGYPPSRAPTHAIVTTGSSRSIGFALESVPAHFRASTGELVLAEPDTAERPHLVGAVELGGRLHPIILVSSMLAAIEARAASTETQGARTR